MNDQGVWLNLGVSLREYGTNILKQSKFVKIKYMYIYMQYLQLSPSKH